VLLDDEVTILSITEKTKRWKIAFQTAYSIYGRFYPVFEVQHIQIFAPLSRILPVASMQRFPEETL
jgi:hypothetical protein